MIVNKIPRLFAYRSDTKWIFSKISINQKGFTLIEIITSIIVMTIIAVIAGLGMVEISKGYVFTRKNAVIAQQGQIAMARLKKELGNIQFITSSSASSISYKRCSDSSPPCVTLKDVTISWAGGSSPLLMDSDTLVNQVTSFKLNYYDSFNSTASTYTASTSIIEIVLQMLGAENTPINFTDRINLYLETGG
ncbi:MAG TPA: type II secretion system protein [Syntrophales bacterium]|nr:type II secretion system protein [Syntrophales bacterium]